MTEWFIVPLEWLKTAGEGFVLNYGYVSIFISVFLEQFLIPLPVDLYLGFAVDNGLGFFRMMTVVILGTLVGTSTGYFLGKYLGHPALEWLVGKRKMARGEKYIKKWGMLGVVIAGLTPAPFKIVTWTAGIFEMPFWRFMTAVVLGRITRYFIVAYAGMQFLENKLYATSEMSAVILGFIQGITEFLPISSSGHLVITETFLELPLKETQLVTFDIFLHGASLLAILIYFWKDWVEVLKEMGRMIKHRKLETDSMAFKLAVATIPAIVAALLFGDFITGSLRNLHSIAIFFIIVGCLFFYTAWKGRWNFRKKITLKKAILIGLAQAMALIPGVSRAGSTIAAAVSMGIKRDVAARFSFMLGGVAILAANVYALLSIFNGEFEMPKLSFVLAGTISTFITSLLAISFLLKFLKRYTMRPFGIYLILAGVAILSFL